MGGFCGQMRVELGWSWGRGTRNDESFVHHRGSTLCFLRALITTDFVSVMQEAPPPKTTTKRGRGKAAKKEESEEEVRAGGGREGRSGEGRRAVRALSLSLCQI